MSSKKLSLFGWIVLCLIIAVIGVVIFVIANRPQDFPEATSVEKSQDIEQLSTFLTSNQSNSIKAELESATDTPWELFSIRKDSYKDDGDKIGFLVADTQTTYIYRVTSTAGDSGEYTSLVNCAPQNNQIGDATCMINEEEGGH